MSFHLITIDQLMQLDVRTLEYALSLFQKELDGTVAYMHESLAARTDQKLLDDLQALLTLRKTFTLRLEELREEATAAQAAVPPLLAAAA